MDELEDRKQMELFSNASLLMDRMKYQNGLMGMQGKRDLYKIFGYKDNLCYDHFRFKNDRQDIAGRIVSAYPDACWAKPPELLENEDIDDETAFEKDFREKMKATNAWHYIHRLDRLVQMGRYATMLIGVADGQTDLTKPMGKGDVVYMMPFSEGNTEIKTLETDPSNPRFGKPLIYEFTMGIDETIEGKSTIEVHHSRVLHVAERTLDNDVYGASILEPIYNRLDDLEKVVGGSAETFWLNSRGGLKLVADKDVTIADPEKLKEAAEDYLNELSRMIRTKGVDVDAINHTVAAPDKHVSVILDLIAGAAGMPKRILIGSERGELASSQDESNWSNRVDERRASFCEPILLRRLLEIFSECGWMEVPEDYKIKWPELNTLSEKEKSEIAKNKASAIATYSNAPEADHIIPPEQFVQEILDMEYRQDEIDEIMRQEEEEIAEQQKQFEEQGLDPSGNPKVVPIDNKPTGNPVVDPKEKAK